MVDMFGECALHSTSTLTRASRGGQPVEMENFFSRLALDIIGKAVFDYDFDSLTHDDPVIQASTFSEQINKQKIINIYAAWH